MEVRHAALPVERLRWCCAADSLPFESTSKLEPIHRVVGQDTAVNALRFGMEIHAPGQNIFVRGLTGTGRMTLIQRLLEELQPSCPRTRDRCYAHNFRNPERPRLITVPWGRAAAFCKRIDDLADFIRDDLEAALSTSGMEARRTLVDQDAQQAIERLTGPLDRAVREAGLSLVTVQVGPVAQAALLPMWEGKPVPPEKWAEMRRSGQVSDEQAAQVAARQGTYEKQVEKFIAEVNDIRLRHSEAVRSLRAEAVRGILSRLAQRIAADFPDDSVRGFLDELTEDAALQRPDQDAAAADGMRRYRVNAILSHSGAQSCPIIIENVPTLANLLGSVDRKFDRFGMGHADHHMITAGSLLRADGGYLIVEVRDLLSEPGAWKVLVRTLRTCRLEIVPPELMLPWTGPFLKPEPIDIDVKVILLGDADTYYLLDAYDADFANLFKVLADFDSTIPRDDEAIAQYGAVLAALVRKEGLLHFERTGLAALIEHGARIASRQDRLTTRFGRLADIAREASFLARKREAAEVTAEDVTVAIQASKQRASLPSRHFQDLLADGTIRVATAGRTVGQINGLAVVQAGPLVSGFPARITATIGPGSAGVIDIERESQLSGAIHTKGFFILGGLLRHLLRTIHPLAFHASVAFEQSYGGIDGDSASAAEICCLLSALTDIPLRQDLAMTGAIDQLGNILAVGAVNEKIEGFYDVCAATGLSGTQGVLIPEANARELMLRRDIVEACRKNRFHIYAVDTVSEALEVLTGVAAGAADEAGEYPKGTLLGVAMERAFEFWLKVSPNVVMTPAAGSGADGNRRPRIKRSGTRRRKG
jgi:ATP-dependent Lon protease